MHSACDLPRGVNKRHGQNIAFQNLTGAIDFNEQIPVFKLKGNVETLNLKNLGITFRRDEETRRPRVNNLGSRLDREQKESGNYYYSAGS